MMTRRNFHLARAPTAIFGRSTYDTSPDRRSLFVAPVLWIAEALSTTDVKFSSEPCGNKEDAGSRRETRGRGRPEAGRFRSRTKGRIGPTARVRGSRTGETSTRRSEPLRAAGFVGFISGRGAMGSRGSGEMNNIMMEEDDPMDLGKPMSADEFRDRFDEGRDPGLGFYRHDSVHQLDNLEEVIAQALPRDRGAMERDTEREGMPLETVIPYDFDPMRDTIIIDIPRGYGAASGKTMEIKCHKFKPGAAVAIRFEFTAAGGVARGSAIGSASDSRTMGTTSEAEPAPSTTGTTGTAGTGSDDGDNATAGKSVLASRAKSATRTTTVSQLCTHGNSAFDDVDHTTEELTEFKAEVTLMDELGRLIDGGEDSDGSGDGAGAVSGEPPGGGESAQSGRRSAREDPSADGIWFTDKKVDADRRRDRERGTEGGTERGTEKVDFGGDAAAVAAARGDASTPGTDERSVSETRSESRADMDEMGVPLDDLEGWIVDSPAKKDGLKKKKKKKLTWFFARARVGASSGLERKGTWTRRVCTSTSRRWRRCKNPAAALNRRREGGASTSQPDGTASTVTGGEAASGGGPIRGAG